MELPPPPDEWEPGTRGACAGEVREVNTQKNRTLWFPTLLSLLQRVNQCTPLVRTDNRCDRAASRTKARAVQNLAHTKTTTRGPNSAVFSGYVQELWAGLQTRTVAARWCISASYLRFLVGAAGDGVEPRTTGIRRVVGDAALVVGVRHGQPGAAAPCWGRPLVTCFSSTYRPQHPIQPGKDCVISSSARQSHAR